MAEHWPCSFLHFHWPRQIKTQFKRNWPIYLRLFSLADLVCLLVALSKLLAALPVQAGVPQQVKPEFECNELWLKMMFIVPFWYNIWHSLDHLDEQGRWFTSSKHFHLFLNSPQYKWHFLGVTRLNLVHTKHFYCKIGKSPLHTGIFKSMCAFEYSVIHKHAHQQSTKPLNWPDQLTVLWCGVRQEGKN